MMMCVVLVHVSGSHLGVVFVGVSAVQSQKVLLIQVELVSNFLGPLLDQVVLTGILGSEDKILVLEAEIHVIVEDAALCVS